MESKYIKSLVIEFELAGKREKIQTDLSVTLTPEKGTDPDGTKELFDFVRKSRFREQRNREPVLNLYRLQKRETDRVPHPTKLHCHGGYRRNAGSEIEREIERTTTRSIPRSQHPSV